MENHYLMTQLFMACNQAYQVAEATVVRPVPDESIETCATPTEPKTLTLWRMLDTSSMAEPHDYRLRQTTSASA